MYYSSHKFYPYQKNISFKTLKFLSQILFESCFINNSLVKKGNALVAFLKNANIFPLFNYKMSTLKLTLN